MQFPSYKLKIDNQYLKDSGKGFYTYETDQCSYRIGNSTIELASLLTSPKTINELVSIRKQGLPDTEEEKIRIEVVESLSDLLDKDLVIESNAGPEKWAEPLLVTGSARSGTSALTRSLSTHPDICLFNEFCLYQKLKNNMDTWHRIQWMDENNPPPKKVSADMTALQNRMVEDLPVHTSNRMTKSWLFDQVKNPPLVYGDKMPYAYLSNIHKITRNYPKARCLITLRDGRAVIASQIRHYHNAIEQGLAPPKWSKPTVHEAQFLWLRSANLWLHLRTNPPVPCLEVRYETAVNDKENLARTICDFVDIDYKEEDFEEFYANYRPENLDAWRNEFPGMDNQLSNEFKDALRQLDYR